MSQELEHARFEAKDNKRAQWQDAIATGKPAQKKFRSRTTANEGFLETSPRSSHRDTQSSYAIAESLAPLSVANQQQLVSLSRER